MCYTCKKYNNDVLFRGITAEKARKEGLNFREYKAKPGKMRVTCWGCKTWGLRIPGKSGVQKSVLTKSMAMSKSWKHGLLGGKLGKVLGGRHAIFDRLRREKKSFHQQPITNAAEETRNSEYFWSVDLQAWAEYVDL